MCLVVISIGLNLSIPIILKHIVESFSLVNKHVNFQVTLLLLAYGIIWTLTQAILQLRQILMFKPLESSIRILSLKLFDHLHSLSVKFHLDKRTGAIIGALEKAQHGMPDVFWGLYFFIIPTVIEIILAISILWYFYGIIYGLILMSIIATFIIFTIFCSERAMHSQSLSNEQHLKTNSFIVDSLLNFMSVRHFNNKKYEMQKCETSLKERENTLVKSLVNMEVIRLGQGIILGCGLILITYVAGKNTLLKIHDISDFVLINGYVLQFAAPLSFFGFILRDMRKGLKDLENVVNLLKTETDVREDENLKTIKKLKTIEFNNVSFGYNHSNLILKNINLKILPGQTIAIVGSTGTGKSTISNLLFRFYNVSSGEILFNGKNIKNLKSENIHELIGIVPQDISLFNTTIYENILYGRPLASKKRIIEAIKLAQLDEFIVQLPDHYNTMVGERGLKLSGGEKQRIAIARLLLKRPSLYILDEATASLDSKTEAHIMKNITSIIKNASCLIIAHRLSTIVYADKIIVLDKGRIKEEGNHAALLKKKGLYYKLWNQQLKNKDNTNEKYF